MPYSNASTESRRRVELRVAALVLLLPALAGCLGETPERALILDTRVVRDGGVALEITQELRFSRTMRAALDHGMTLRLVYRVEGCASGAFDVLELRYVPLTRHYELRRFGDAQGRSFARRSALFAALDRVRLPLQAEPTPDCRGQLQVALDLTSLPTPLRLPAFLQRDEWRMVSPVHAWPTRS
jgi:hypothetical protein